MNGTARNDNNDTERADRFRDAPRFSVLADRTYRHMFLAQIVALVGTGLATVALGLLAFDLAGKDASAVLGTALAIKMVAYVLIAPLAGAYANRMPRRALLVSLDVARLAVVLLLPFVNQIWQIYALIFILQSCSAAFTPALQATIPDILPAEVDYTKAQSLSRLAYDLETLLSPALAAVLLLVVSYQALLLGTALGFLGSALLVVSVVLPRATQTAAQPGVRRKLTQGLHIYLATPRLRGLLALNLAAVALSRAAFGAGSMLMALILPRVLERRSDRTVMLAAGAVLTVTLAMLAAVWSWLSTMARWPVLLSVWLMLGATYAALVTPGGRLLRRSSHEADRPALFAAQFSLSHVCWLVAYPLVGWLGTRSGVAAALWAMVALAAVGAAFAQRVWPTRDVEVLPHGHEDLPPDHPHLAATGPMAGSRHAHVFVIDGLHTRWPS